MYTLARLRILPSVPEAGEAQHTSVRRADEIRLPTVRLLEPFVLAARRNDAPMAPEGITEHGFGGDRLRPRIEACRQLLQRLFPPPWNEAPAHGDEFGCGACGRPHDIDRVRRRNVVVGLEILGR